MSLTYWIIVSFLIFLIFEMLRRKVLLEKYAMVWLGIGALIVFGSLFPSFVNRFSQVLGFQVLSNFVLFFFGIVNLLVVMQLSLALGKAEQEIQELAQEIGITNSRVKEIKQMLDSPDLKRDIEK